jgi:hypothetical protein
LQHSKAAAALISLQELGFVVVTQKGGFNRKGDAARYATTWRLTEFNCDVTLRLASKEFMRWQREPKI